MPNAPVDVTAGAPTPESYTINADGTVTDDITGLMWQQAVPTTTYTWANGIAYCPTLTLGGHNDWRLPSRIDLISIVDYGSPGPTLNVVAFPATPTNLEFWSSTPLAGSPSSAWSALFQNGASYTIGVTAMANVRCVR